MSLIKGSAAEPEVLEGGLGVGSSANGFVGCLSGTTDLMLPHLTPGRGFLHGNCGCERPETHVRRGSGACSAGDVGCLVRSKVEF